MSTNTLELIIIKIAGDQKKKKLYFTRNCIIKLGVFRTL